MTIPPLYLPLHQGAAAAVRDTLAHLPTVYLSLASMFREVCNDPEAHWPHPVYLMNEDDLLAGDGLNTARLVGWQFLAKAAGGRAYAIEVQGGLAGKDCRFANLAHGPFVDGLCQALENPDLQEQLSSGSAQLAVLVLSELGTQAAWFRTTNPAQGFLFVVQKVSDVLRPWPAFYTVKQFEEALRQEVQRAA
ncbi:MAG: hypothetical protein HY011_10915 [Acidobacteria bacterium]|nr:hypothetical protein [Acidobacteriota bacterium]